MTKRTSFAVLGLLVVSVAFAQDAEIVELFE